MNLKSLRQRRGLTQKELAESVGMKQNYISELETGAKKGSITALIRLSEVLGVTVNELLGEDFAQ